MILSDQDILHAIKEKRIKISRFKDYKSCIHCASIDFHLSPYFKIFKHSKISHIDTRNSKINLNDFMETVRVAKDKPYFVQPGEYLLGSTIEKIELPNNIVGRLEGRSSLARLGLIIHATAGFL